MSKIKLRNFCLWFWDQLHHEHPFRNLFITRNAWSAFSVYSHIRRSDGVAKIPYPSKKVAQKAADKMSHKHGVHFSVYKCLHCDGWHVGRNKDNKVPANTSVSNN